MKYRKTHDFHWKIHNAEDNIIINVDKSPGKDEKKKEFRSCDKTSCGSLKFQVTCHINKPTIGAV